MMNIVEEIKKRQDINAAKDRIANRAQSVQMLSADHATKAFTTPTTAAAQGMSIKDAFTASDAVGGLGGLGASAEALKIASEAGQSLQAFAPITDAASNFGAAVKGGEALAAADAATAAQSAASTASIVGAVGSGIEAIMKHFGSKMDKPAKPGMSAHGTTGSIAAQLDPGLVDPYV